MFGQMFLLAVLATSASIGFDEAKALADKNEAGLSREMYGELLRAQGNAMGHALAVCAQPEMDLAPFTLVLVLDGDGTVARSWREGETPLARCMHERLVDSGFQGSWPAPFYTSIELSLQAGQPPI